MNPLKDEIKILTGLTTVLAGLLGVSQPTWAADGRVVNLSTRALVETGEEVMIGGFIIEDGSRQVLIQALGPELVDRGISNALADPVLTVIQTHEGEPPRTSLDPPLEILVNDNWEDSQSQLVSDLWGGNSNLTGGSLSSAAVLNLVPGGYTARVEGKNGTTGVAIVEVYDTESADGDGQVVNLSTRALVKMGEEVMIGGFIIEEGTRRVLIQAVGPELVDRDISNALADPVLTVIQTHEGEPPRTPLDPPLELLVNDNWEDSQRQLVSDIWGGSPPLTGGSLSSAAVLTLQPGGYTARVEGKNGTTGVAIVEVYGIDSNPDRVALTALFNATNGANWTDRTNWLSNVPLDQWHGVEVDESGRVIHLDLSANQLSGKIPTELGDFTNLQTLSLHTNELTGNIPAELGNLANLQILWLQRNQLSGQIPAELGNLTSLQELSLRTNELTGSIPAQLGNLTRLQGLWLQQNQLSGSIPAELGNMASLQTLSIHTNELTGNIPAELGNLSNMQILWLQRNQLSGNIPAELGNLTSLQELSLHTNELSRTIPAALGNLTSLQALWLQRNELRGAIPAELGNLTNLQSLNLHTNQLGGSIPLSFKELPISIFRYDNTDVCVPAGAALREWLDSIQTHIGTGVDCQGSESSDRDILETLYNATDGPNWTSSANWLTEAPVSQWHGVTVDGNNRVIELNLSSNQLNGPIPAELGNLANLQILWLQRNQLSGQIPAELGNLTSLQELSLHTNELSRTIPAALGNLTSLQALWLQRNELRGAIPAELGNLTNLQSLNLHTNQLGGSIPLSFKELPISIFRYDNTDVCVPSDAALREWLDSIQTHIGTGVDCQGSESSDRDILEILYNATDGPNWTSSANWLTEAPVSQWHGVTVDGNNRVIELNLSSNQLNGPIPAELGNLAILQILWLQRNQLSGNIPAELGNLTSLIELSLRTNELTGSIPAQLGNLTRLQGLWLQQNQLNGNIPAELGNLASLQELSLRTNHLTETIPVELGNLASLQTLNLDSNELSGNIPEELGDLTNLQTLSLHTNELSGNIPATLGNLANVEILWLHLNQLSGNIPVELGNLASLQELSLRTNHLTGTIPVELGNLSSLQGLWLQQNQLSGNIPVELGDLTNLQTLSLHTNLLGGNIPGELGNLANLQILRLQQNQLSGNIPAELGNLINLETLDLHTNELSGNIPAELGNLTNLQTLILHTNQLGGSIPLSFTRLGISIFRYENTDLCVPADAALREWLGSILTHTGTGEDCE